MSLSYQNNCYKETVLIRRHRILIFDSGLGGISVYHEIRKILPDVHYFYVFDNVDFPYGNKEDKFLIQRAEKIISEISNKYLLDMVVIACNTVSTVALSSLRAQFKFPIVGVVPAIKRAAELTRNGIIGLLATPTTISQSYTHELIAKFASKYTTLMFGSLELVTLAENKLQNIPISIDKLQNILKTWLIKDQHPDIIVLGCTHFQFLTEELYQIFPRVIKILDSSVAVARQIDLLLKHIPLQKIIKGTNTAFCIDFTNNSQQKFLVLQRYGFKILEPLLLK
ncbi:MAG: glutamate racemase [Candidatus Dasytiphilus stammeri]